MDTTGIVTKIYLPFKNFSRKMTNAFGQKDIVLSKSFKLLSRPSVQFAVFANPQGSLCKKTYIGLTLMKSDNKKPVELRLKFWFENKDKKKFWQGSVEKHSFEKTNHVGFDLVGPSEDKDVFFKILDNHEPLHIYLELTDLSTQALEAPNSRKLHQTLWSLYTAGEHDAVIKVGTQDFKILKALFMAQSDVFAKVFAYEKMISVQIHDIDMTTMEQLIEWIYTGKLKDDSQIEQLLVVSCKYDIPLLKKTCALRLRDTLNKTNVLDRLIMATVYKSDELKDAALEFIRLNITPGEPTMFYASPDWTKILDKDEALTKQIGTLLCKNTGKRISLMSCE